MKSAMHAKLLLLVPMLGGIVPGALLAQDVDNLKPQGKAPVAELFEDDAEGLLRVLTNPGDGPGTGDPDETTRFSGKRCIKISHYQRFQRRVPGWEFAIRERPAAGEYRYLRFAWKATACNGLMLQLHDATDWHIRYTAGVNAYGWPTRFVADTAPNNWSLVTIDLFKDFGERTLTGIAFTISGGRGAAFFDHVYLGRAVADLDRIDAEGLGVKPANLSAAELEQLWRELAADDAGVAYRALWRMVSGRERSVDFINARLAGAAAVVLDADKLRRLIRDLDADSFALRETAFTELKKYRAAATPLLEAALASAPSIEARRRLEILLAGVEKSGVETQRRATALKVVDLIREAQQREKAEATR